MTQSAENECFVCRKHRGLEVIPGGAIYEDNLIYISHSRLWEGKTEHYRGHLFVEPKRHAPGLADLTEEEAQAIGLFISRTARALIATEGMNHVYAFVLGEHVPHLHVHLIGRYPGTPPQYSGQDVIEWPDAPRGGAPEIEVLAERVRTYLKRLS